MGASNKGTLLSTLLREDPHRQMNEDNASPIGPTSPSPDIANRCSSEVGNDEIIRTRATDWSNGLPDNLKSVQMMTRFSWGEKEAEEGQRVLGGMRDPE